MKNQLRELEIGDQIADLIYLYKIPLQNFGLELIFATPTYNRVRITMDYFPENFVSVEATPQEIDFIALARDLADIFGKFALPTDMFGLTIFVNSKDFDILAAKNPAIAERDVLGRLENKNSKLIWYIQIIRLLDVTKSNPIVT